MKKVILFPIRSALIAAIIIFLVLPLSAQQHVIAQKNVTRPQAGMPSIAAFITSFTATKSEGYNKVSWSTTYQQQTRKFIVEYSTDGINYQTAGEALADRNLYSMNHYTLESRPVLYRMRSEQFNGKFVYSPAYLLDGSELASPVKIYPTILSGTSITVETKLPVEKIIVVDQNGTELFTKEFAEINTRLSVQLPTLSKGVYFMSFIGRDGWKSTEKFIVP